MERTTTEGKVIYLGELEFTGLMKSLITWHKFHNNNQPPERIILPNITEVDGVTIEQEVDEAFLSPPTTPPHTIVSRKKEVKDAVTS